MNGPHFNRLILNFSTLVCILAFLACAKKQAELVVDTGVVAYIDSTSEYPRLVFADGQTSQNDRCMVRMSKLNPKMPPIYVNGKAVGFC